MAIPLGDLVTGQLDAGTDVPTQARAEILAVAIKVNTVLAKQPIYADGEQSGVGSQRFGLLKVGVEAIATWPSTWRVVDIGGSGAFVWRPEGTIGVAFNAYNDGTNWRARTTGSASVLQFETNGAEVYYTAPSVAAGAILAFTAVRTTSAAGVMTLASIEHTGHPVSGYVKVGAGKYLRTSALSYVTLTSGTLTAIAAPAGAKGLTILVLMDVQAGNVVNDRLGITRFYADSAGTIQISEMRCFGRENPAQAGGILNMLTQEVSLPVISGFAYTKFEIQTGPANAHYSPLGYST